MSLLPADEKEGKLELGRKIGDSVGLMSAGIMSAGRVANEVFVPGGAGFMRVDLKTGEQTPLVLGGTYRPSGEIVCGRDGKQLVGRSAAGADIFPGLWAAYSLPTQPRPRPACPIRSRPRSGAGSASRART